MGDLNARAIAQNVHEAALVNAEAMSEAEVAWYMTEAPRIPIWHFVDDNHIVTMVEKSELGKPDGPNVQKLHRCQAAHAGANLPEAIEKAFEGRTEWTTLGTEVRSGGGTVAAPMNAAFFQQVCNWPV